MFTVIRVLHKILNHGGVYKVNWWLPLTWFQTLFLGYEFQIRPYCRKSDFENNFIFWFHRICLRDRKLCCETNMHKQLEQEYAQLDEECRTVSEEIQALEGKLEPWKKLYILIIHVFTTFPIFPRKEIQPFGWNLAQLMYSINYPWCNFARIIFKQKGLCFFNFIYLYCYHSYAYQDINQSDLFVRLYGDSYAEMIYNDIINKIYLI